MQWFLNRATHCNSLGWWCEPIQIIVWLWSVHPAKYCRTSSISWDAKYCGRENCVLVDHGPPLR